MSKKLLSEAQVRRFQSLASIKPLQEMGNYAMKRDEEKEEPMEEAMHEEEVDEGMYKRDEEPMEGMYKEEEEEKPMEEKMDDGDVDVDMDADGDDDVEIEEEMVEKAAMAMKDLQALVDALGGAAGAMDMDDDPEPDMPGMDDAPDMDDEDEDKPMPLEEEELLELALEGIEYQPSQKEIVKEVAKRVARRLVEAKEAHSKLNKALGKK